MLLLLRTGRLPSLLSELVEVFHILFGGLHESKRSLPPYSLGGFRSLSRGGMTDGKINKLGELIAVEVFAILLSASIMRLQELEEE